MQKIKKIKKTICMLLVFTITFATTLNYKTEKANAEVITATTTAFLVVSACISGLLVLENADNINALVDSVIQKGGNAIDAIVKRVTTNKNGDLVVSGEDLNYIKELTEQAITELAEEGVYPTTLANGLTAVTVPTVDMYVDYNNYISAYAIGKEITLNKDYKFKAIRVNTTHGNGFYTKIQTTRGEEDYRNLILYEIVTIGNYNYKYSYKDAVYENLIDYSFIPIISNDNGKQYLAVFYSTQQSNALRIGAYLKIENAVAIKGSLGATTTNLKANIDLTEQEAITIVGSNAITNPDTLVQVTNKIGLETDGQSITDTPGLDADEEVTGISGLLQNILNGLNQGLADIVGGIADVLDSIKTQLEKVINATKEAVGTAVNTLTNALANVKEAILAQIQTLVDVITKPFTDFAEHNKNWWNNFPRIDLLLYYIIYILYLIIMLFIAFFKFIFSLYNPNGSIILPDLVVQSVDFLHAVQIPVLNLTFIGLINLICSILAGSKLIKILRGKVEKEDSALTKETEKANRRIK